MAKKKNTQVPNTFYVVGDNIIQNGKKEKWDDTLYDLALKTVRESSPAPAYSYDPAVSEEDRARAEWLERNQLDWDINQANERANFGTMNDKEMSTYNTLFNTVGKGVAQDYYKEIKPELEYRRDYGVDYSRKMAETQKTLSDLAKEYASRPDFITNNQLRQEDRDRANFISNGFRDFNQSVDDTYRNLMTDEENEVYNYLLNTQGRDKAEEYYQTALPVLKHRATTNNAKWWEEEGEKHPYSTTAATVLMNIEKPFEWANQVGQFISGQNIDHTDLKNNMVSTGVKYGRKGVGNYITSGNFLKDELVKRGVSEDTAKRMLESDPELVKNIGEVTNFLYGTGASMGDFLFNMALGNMVGGVYGASAEGLAKAQKVAEAFSLAVMGTGAASDATLEARERGLDSNQAFLLGSIAGLAEILTEKVSLETLLDPGKSLSKGQITKYILKNMGAEGSEEAASDLVNTVADLVISSDKAELRQRVNELIAEGKSEGEAYGIALMELGGQVALDALGGAISGGVMAGVGVGTHSIRSDRLANDYNLNNPDVMNEQIQRGLSYDPSTQAYELADRLQNKVTNNESINNMERAGVLLANEEAKGDASRALSARISEVTPDLDKDTANYITALYDPATNADEDSYLVEANDAYLAGYEGEDKNSLPTENLSPIQTDALYELGKQKREEDNELRIRESGERNDSESTSRQVQSVEESTGGNQERKAEIRSGGDSEANAFVYSESKIDLRLKDGVGKNQIVQGGETTDFKLAKSEAKNAGYNLVGVKDAMDFKDPTTGKTYQAEGYIDYANKKIYVTVNSSDYTSSQLTRHELFHDKIDNGSVNLDKTLNAVREKMGDVQFDRAIDAYADMYNGMYDDLEGEERAKAIFTEMACDSAGDMNVFAGRFTTMAQEYAKTQETIKESTTFNEDNQANAPPKQSKKANDNTSVDNDVDALAKEIFGEDATVRRSMKPTFTSAPTEDDDGFKLTKGMSEYMKASQNRDDKGRLMTMYHGSDNGVFSEFKKSDDNLSYFFTNNKWVAKSYVENPTFENPDANYNFDELSRLYSEESFGILSKTKDGYAFLSYAPEYMEDTYSDANRDYNMVDEGDERFVEVVEETFNSLKDAQEYLFDNFLNPNNTHAESKGTMYSVYLNCEKPLFVDANGANWNNIKYAPMTEEQRKKSGVLENKVNELYDVLMDKGIHHVAWGLVQNYEEWDTLDFVNRIKWLYPEYNLGDDELSKLSNMYDEIADLVSEGVKVDDHHSYKTRELARMAFDLGYDSVIIDDVVDIGYYGGTNKESRIVIVFDPSQIKSVYNENPTKSKDIRKSTKATKGEDLAKQNKQLEKEIARISKNAEKWRNETKISNPIRPKEADVNKFTKEFKQRFSSTLPLNTLKKRVDALFKTMLNVDKLSEDARWASIKAMGIDLASDLVNSSKELKVVYPEYEDIQRELMRGVTISDEDKANIPDFNDFRKRNIRNVKIVKEGIAVDSLYQELNQQYPYLFPETLTNPADQLMRMAEVAEEIRPDLVNPYEEYGLDMASIIESVANEIIEETYGQIAPYETFADKKATEIKELKTQTKKQAKELDKKVAETDELKTRFKEKAKALRDKRDEDIKSLKKHNAERRRQESNRRKASKLREKITRHAKALSDKLLKPTDKKHITEGREVRGGRDVEPLRRVVAEVLSLINQESSFGYTEEGKRTKDKDRIVFAAKKTEAWNRLLKEYQKIVNDGTYQVDESLEDVRGYISQIAQYAKTPISELGVEQLQTIYDCLRSLENTIEHAEKMLSADKSPAQLAYALKDETKNNKQRVVRGLPLYDNFVMGMVSPQAFFERLGKTLYNFAFKGLRQAQNSFIELTKEFQKWASKNIDGKTKYEWEHDEHTVKLGGKEVKMSSAQLMDLYILSNREQGADHIYQGGIELRNKPTGIEIAKDVAKNIKEAFTHTESEREESVIRRITPEEVANACSKLTREQLELAQKMSKYVNEDLSAIGNKASMDVFGYEKFLEGAYWHIKTVASDRIKNNSVTTDALPVSVGSAGFTKPTVENAQSAIYVGSVFTDFMETVVNMNNYASYLAIQEDMKRLLNYKFYDEKGNPAGNVEQILNEVFGQGQGVKYWTKLMSDIASGVKAYDLLQGNMLGKFKSTAVGANLRVIVQQPTAILRALDMLDAKYLAMGMANPLKGSKEAIKYSPLAQWKSWGYFDINTGRSLEDLIYGTPNAFRKAQEYMMEGAAKADDFAWGVLWNAVKAEIKDTTNLKEGSQEFYEAVKERFEDIVDRTQVVDGVLQRSAFLRDGGLYTKMLTAFMGEPIKQYNQFMNTIYKWRNGQAKGADLLRTGTALIAAGTLNALVKSLVDAMRHSKRDKDFWEQYIDDLLGKDDKGLDFWKFMSGNFGEQFDPLTYLPYIRDVESAFKGYTVARTDMAIWTDMIKEVQQFMKAVSGDSKYTLQYATERLILQMSKLFGIPASNLERDVKAVIDTLINNTAPTAVAYKWNRYFYTANNSDNKKMYIKLLREAYEKGDTETYEYILKDLEAQGVSEPSIKTQLDNIQKDEIKKETGAKKVTVKDIENRVSAEIFGANGTSTKVDITDNPTYKEVSSSKIWSQASPAMQQSINEDIANLQSGSNSKLQAQVSKAKSYGKSESDWLLFTLARKVVDANEGNNNQHYDKTEETKAGQMTGFTYEQIKQIKSAK